MASICSFNRIQAIALLVASLVVITVLMILFFFNYPTLAKKRVIQAVLFTNGSESMGRFENSSYVKSLRMNFYLYNVTNPNDVINSGAKIKLEEIGPFVYMEYREKEFIDNNQTSGLITYKIRKRYNFNKELSIKNFDPFTARIYWPNVPLLVAQDLIGSTSLKIPNWVISILNMEIKIIGEQAFINDTVDNLLFSGSSSKLFTAMNKLLSRFLKPWPLKDNKFGILYDKNFTWYPERDRVYTMSAGFGPNRTYENLNEFVYVNGSDKLPFWPDQPPNCNSLGGTDGLFFRPFLNESQNLKIYASDLCRKVDFKFDRITSVTGVQAFKYSLDSKSFMSGRNNPENQCYCLANRNNLTRHECDLDGIVDLANCVQPTIIASGAHFIHGSKSLIDQFDGLTPPDPLAHEPWIFVEPNTGITLKARVPIQLNVRMLQGQIKLFNFLSNNKSLIVPLLWIDETNDLDEDSASELKSQLVLLDSWFVTMVLGGAIFFLIAILIVVFVSCIKYKQSREIIGTEREPLISDSDRASRVLAEEAASRSGTVEHRST